MKGNGAERVRILKLILGHMVNNHMTVISNDGALSKDNRCNKFFRGEPDGLSL